MEAASQRQDSLDQGRLLAYVEMKRRNIMKTIAILLRITSN